MFDKGPVDNLITYGSVKPPPFNLSNTKIPVALFWSQNDFVAHPKVRQFFLLVNRNNRDTVSFHSILRYSSRTFILAQFFFIYVYILLNLLSAQL